MFVDSKEDFVNLVNRKISESPEREFSVQISENFKAEDISKIVKMYESVGWKCFVSSTDSESFCYVDGFCRKPSFSGRKRCVHFSS